jgi:hypothetical protein
LSTNALLLRFANLRAVRPRSVAIGAAFEQRQPIG